MQMDAVCIMQQQWLLRALTLHALLQSGLLRLAESSEA